MINWKLRFQNKVTLTSLVICTITFVYTVLGIFGIVSPISQDNATNVVLSLIDILVAAGIVVDPTTYGAGDSTLALTREHINVTKPKERGTHE